MATKQCKLEDGLLCLQTNKSLQVKRIYSKDVSLCATRVDGSLVHGLSSNHIGARPLSTVVSPADLGALVKDEEVDVVGVALGGCYCPAVLSTVDCSCCGDFTVGYNTFCFNQQSTGICSTGHTSRAVGAARAKGVGTVKTLPVFVAEGSPNPVAAGQVVGHALLARSKEVAVLIHTSCLLINKPVTGTKTVEEVTPEFALCEVGNMDHVRGDWLLTILEQLVCTFAVAVVCVAGRL